MNKNSSLKVFLAIFFWSLCLCLIITSCQNDTSSTTQLVKNLPITGNPAIDGLTNEIEQQPNDPRLYAQRGALFYEEEGYDEAIKDLKKALSYDSTNVIYPERVPTLLKLCEFQLILKKHDESINTINNILKVEPLNANAFFMLGLNFKELGNVDRAIGSFQTAVENDPDLVDAWINLGQLHAQKKSNLARHLTFL